MVKRKKGNSEDTGKRGRGAASKRASAAISTSSKEAFLSSVETEIITYLKQLSSLPSPSIKKEDDPLTKMLQKYTQKWRGVEK